MLVGFVWVCGLFDLSFLCFSLLLGVGWLVLSWVCCLHCFGFGLVGGCGFWFNVVCMVCFVGCVDLFCC